MTSTPAQQLDAIVEAALEDDSCSCLLRVAAAPESALSWAGAAGTVSRDDLTRVAPGDAFRIASITKTFTAAVVLQLVAEGRVELDEPAVAFLPSALDDVIGRLHVLDESSFGRMITVRQLLDHSSGMFDYAGSPKFFEAIAADPSRPWSPVELLEGACRWGTPSFPPGLGYGYAYSDTGYVVLGLMIEHLDELPLHESYRRRILDPHGLVDTYLEGYEPHRGPTLTHAFDGARDVMVVHGSADWAGGGLVSTCRDLETFVVALMDGRVVPSAQLHEMLRWEFRSLDPERHTPGYLGYGLGVDVRVSHGRMLRGHRGHWGVLMHHDPATGLTITGTINQAARRPDREMHAITEIVGHGLDD